jgi:hypothetical protein
MKIEFRIGSRSFDWVDASLMLAAVGLIFSPFIGLEWSRTSRTRLKMREALRLLRF